MKITALMFLKFYSHSDEAHAGAERPGQEAGARLGVGAHVVLALVTRQVHLIHNTCPHHHKQHGLLSLELETKGREDFTVFCLRVLFTFRINTLSRRFQR